MSLSDIPLGQKVFVTSINADVMLKKRLMSLGITKFRHIEVLEESIGRQNLKVSLGSTEVALRLSEADKIMVAKV